MKSVATLHSLYDCKWVASGFPSQGKEKDCSHIADPYVGGLSPPAN